MSDHTRRGVISTLAGITVPLSGCSTGVLGRGTESDGGTTASGGSANVDPYRALSIRASVIREPSDEDPLGIELVVGNASSRELPIIPAERSGLPLEHLPRFAGDEIDLVAYPERPKHVSLWDRNQPAAPEGGCWRFPDATIAVEASAFEAVLQADAEYTIVHDVYNERGDGCYPTGRYYLSYGIEIAKPYGDGPTLPLQFIVEIADGEFDVRGFPIPA